MQLIILTPGFPADEADTACIPSLQDFVMGWREVYPEVSIHVVAFQYPRQTRNYSWNGIPVYAAGGKDRKGIHRLITWMRIFSRLNKIKITGDTFLVTYFLTEAAWFGQWYSTFRGIKQIAMAAGQDVKKENPWLKRIAFSKLPVVTFNKKMSDELFISTGHHAAAVIPIGILVNNIIEETNDRPIDVITVGSLIPLKQVDLALQILSTVKKKFSHLTALIVGKGPLHAQLLSIAHKLQIYPNVTFTGELKREEVIEKMKQSKLLLHTSVFEGQSTVISEALACGMYVVCFNVGKLTDHEKITVCLTQQEMEAAVERILGNTSLIFKPVVPVTISESTKAFHRFLSHPA